MTDVVIYSKNTYLGAGLTALCSVFFQPHGTTVQHFQSYLAALRAAKTAKFIFFDECDGIIESRRKLYLIKKTNPEIKIFSLTTGKEFNFNIIVRKYIVKKNSFKYSSLSAMSRVIQSIKYSRPTLDSNIDYSDKAKIYQCTLPSLTERESLVLKLIMKGTGNSQIATLLDIAPKTTSGHRRSLFRKMNVRSVAELFDYMH